MAQQHSKEKEHWIGIEITRRCNLSCPHCFTNSGGRDQVELPATQAERLLRGLGALGSTVSFSGGEPLLRKDLERLMLGGRDAGVKGYSIVTNGAACTPQRAKSLRHAGLEAAMVSVDGVDAEDHRAVRACPRKDFDRALQAIERLQAEGVRVCIAMLLTRRNIERFDEMVALCQRMNVSELRTCTLIPTGRAAVLDEQARARLVLDELLLQRWWETYRAVQESGVLAISQDHGVGPWKKTRSLRCIAGRDVAYVDATGDVYPCPGLLLPEFRVGNLAETDISGLLDSPAMHRVHELRRDELTGRCGRCGYSACSGGCRGAAHSFTGDIRGEVPYCLAFVERQAIRPALRFSDERLRELGKKYGILKDEGD